MKQLIQIPEFICYHYFNNNSVDPKLLHKFVVMDSPAVRIYSAKDVPRLRYIAGIILGDILGLSWEVITDKRKLGKHPVINYSNELISGSFRIMPDTLLFETGISPREINVKEWNKLPVFFQTLPESDLPFDIFAASFYLVSRYEEYLEFEPDEYGRFKAASSLGFKNGFLGIPVVDLWAKELSRALLRKFHTLTFKRNEYRSLLTVDTDQPFAYLGKGLFRSLGGLIKDIKRNNGSAAERYKIVTTGGHDPYEVFDYITDQIALNQSDVKFFFPVGDYSKYDKNPSWKNGEYCRLIHSMASRYNVGVHPSYHAAGSHAMINTEVLRLKTILNKEITSSRFHYLRIFMPQSYRALSSAGLTEDYSLGYPDETGYRAGIARPFNFYDLPEDKPTTLRIIPFQVMDITLYQYKNLDPQSSKDLILKLINETRKAGGLFVSIWHNTSLLDNEEWSHWREVFEFMLKNQS
jgi:hypothetical protein